ncbi:MAG: DUF924 family protein [Alphaproteobacteria bacterium]|nr:DUF924 family protein [Alphaproteobacteria bacterium]
MHYQDILDFWFGELTPLQWYKADTNLDAAIVQRFEPAYRELSLLVPPSWREGARSILAAVIMLDQFPRNMFRRLPQAFATDATALALSQEAIEKNFDSELNEAERQFLYMPFQHAEDRALQTRSVQLFERLGNANVLDFAHRHRTIIERFGRFPHRNAIMGRPSSAEELEFLKQPGSSF